MTPGIASDETLLYGVEVKFYSNKVVVNKEFETSIGGLRAVGDGASVTRGCSRRRPTDFRLPGVFCRKFPEARIRARALSQTISTHFE